MIPIINPIHAAQCLNLYFAVNCLRTNMIWTDMDGELWWFECERAEVLNGTRGKDWVKLIVFAIWYSRDVRRCFSDCSSSVWKHFRQCCTDRHLLARRWVYILHFQPIVGTWFLPTCLHCTDRNTQYENEINIWLWIHGVSVPNVSNNM